MKWLAALGILVIVIYPHKTERLTQRVYLQKCTGTWWLNGQGTDENADWVDIVCDNNESPE